MPILCLLVNEPLNKICQCYMKKMSGPKRATMCESIKRYSLGSDVYWEINTRISQVGEF